MNTLTVLIIGITSALGLTALGGSFILAPVRQKPLKRERRS